MFLVLLLKAPITRSNFNFPWQFELLVFNCIAIRIKAYINQCLYRMLSVNRGTPKRYHIICRCKYFALNILSGTKTQDLTPKRHDYQSCPCNVSIEVLTPPPPLRCKANTQLSLSITNLYMITNSI